MDFSDLLDHDKTMPKKIEDFQGSVKKIEDMLGVALEPSFYENLQLNEKVDYDLFIAYTLNSLYWLYLRAKGINPMKTGVVKDELGRVREYFFKAKQAHDRNTIRPTLKKDVAARFIKHGIKQSDKHQPTQGSSEHGQKRKRSSDEDNEN